MHFKNSKLYYCYVFQVLSVLIIASCGQQSQVECGSAQSNSQCVQPNTDDQVALAIRNGDLVAAETLLIQMITEFPTEYIRYPRLASVQASLAGFNLLQAAAAAGQSGDVIENISKFLPDPVQVSAAVYAGYVAKMESAKRTLESIPISMRTNSATEFADSSEFQLTIYSSALSVMLLNKFAPKGDPLQDANRLAQLTVADAVAILGSLQDALQYSQSDNPELATKLGAVLSEVSSQEGADDQQKLQAYLESRS